MSDKRKNTTQIEGFAKADGRPTELTEELIAQYAKLLPKCSYVETVSAFLGVDRTTAFRWIKRGQKEIRRMVEEETDLCLKSEVLFVRFCNVHKTAIAQGEIIDCLHIANAAENGVWQAAAWRLERRLPDRYGAQGKEIRILEKELAELRAKTEQYKSREMEVADLKKLVKQQADELERLKANANGKASGRR